MGRPSEDDDENEDDDEEACMSAKVLLIGYGNPGRMDDGLGPAFAEVVEKMGIPDLMVDADYQLTVEDAADIAGSDVVVFVDASVVGPEPFFFRAVEPSGEPGFSTHSIAPEAVMALAYELFGAKTKGYVLGIKGYTFNEFGEGLSAGAMKNLAMAVKVMEPVFRAGTFDLAVADRNMLKK